MPYPSSHMVDVMQRLRQTLLEDLAPLIPQLQVEVANPAKFTTISRPLITLFVYRFERFDPATMAERGMPVVLAMHLLLTTYAPIDDDETVGVRELKMLALAGRALGSERDLGIVPIVDTAKIGTLANLPDETLRARVSLQNLENEDINNVWTTQTGGSSDVPYRASLAYVVRFGLLTPFAPVLDGPPILSIGYDLLPATPGNAPLPDDPSTPVPLTNVPDVSGALALVAAGGALKAGLAEDRDTNSTDPVAISVLAVSASAMPLDLALDVLGPDGVWQTNVAGRLSATTLQALAAANVTANPAAQASALTITLGADDSALRLRAAPGSGDPLPVFPAVTIAINRPIEGGS